MSLGRWVYRGRWLILAAWLAVAAALVGFGPDGDPASNERSSFLPESTPYRQAMALMKDRFPRHSGLSEAMILFERPGEPLREEDKQFIADVADAIRTAGPDGPPREDIRQMKVVSPGLIDLALRTAQTIDVMKEAGERLGDLLPVPLPLPGNGRNRPTGGQPPDAVTVPAPAPNPLRSKVTEAGQAAIVRVEIPAGFITHRSSQIVRHIRNTIAAVEAPAGLRVAVSGSGGYGFDYAGFVRQSHDQTMITTLLAVVLILLVVYRAPLGAIVPLVSISLAAAVVIRLLSVAQGLGFSIGLAERIFVFVLMYGAGIDYSLLLISRYREKLSQGMSSERALTGAVDATSPAILASGGTDAVGILMLVFTQFLIFQTTGPAVAGAILVAILASLTLVPALTALLGTRLFWPRRIMPSALDTPNRTLRVWPRLATLVTRRPAAVLVVVLALLAIPAWHSRKIEWVYDALTGIQSRYPDNVGNAAAGVDIARRHWPIGELAPMIVLVDAGKPLPSDRWLKISRNLSDRLASMDDVLNIRSLNEPLGRDVRLEGGSISRNLIRRYAEDQYLGTKREVMRLEVVTTYGSMSNEAMALLEKIRSRCEEAVAPPATGNAQATAIQPVVHLAGASAHMAQMRRTTQSDFRRLLVLVLAVILIIVLLLLRDIVLTLFMVAAIGVSYLSTLGISSWVFTGLLGEAGLDWKVEVFLFVVMAAVGVDYNIFLAARLSQEARRHPPREAIRQAIIHTGPVISSCGLIMAATLGSLMVGQIELLRQLGFSLGLGMLIDTFVVRPLLLPSFAALLNRTGRAARWIG